MSIIQDADKLNVKASKQKMIVQKLNFNKLIDYNLRNVKIPLILNKETSTSNNGTFFIIQSLGVPKTYYQLKLSKTLHSASYITCKHI